jgi:hypothetical protein
MLHSAVCVSVVAVVAAVGCRARTGAPQTPPVVGPPPPAPTPTCAQAAAELRTKLRRAFPSLAFSVAWTPGRLRVEVDKPYEVLTGRTGAAPPPGERHLLSGIVRLCMRQPAPETSNLVIGATQRDGHKIEDRNSWSDWRSDDAAWHDEVRGARPGEEPVHALPAGYLYAAPGYEVAAKDLLARLGRAQPRARFSLEWTPERLRVCVTNRLPELDTHNWPNPSQPSQPPPEAVSRFYQSVIQSALRTPSPPTKGLWTSDQTRSEERGSWAGYERYFGTKTPRPTRERP